MTKPVMRAARWLRSVAADGMAGAIALAALVLVLVLVVVMVLALGGAAAEALPSPSPSPAPLAAESAGKPQRIVSLNLCTDQLLMQIVDHGRIRAITALSQDAQISGMAQEAQKLPATMGVAEEVIAMRPDLVLAGTFSTRATVAILRRLGYEVVDFAPETDFASIKANIRKMARAVGEPARGEAIVRSMEAELARIPAPPAERPVYANYNANGYTSGNGDLITAVANAAGFDMLGQRLDLAGPEPIALEQMLVTRPDLIDLGEDGNAPTLATEIFRHPALQRLIRERATVDVPAKYTICGSPRTMEAVHIMVEARRRLG